MSQVRKTIFTTLALMMGTVMLSGCGIQGDLYAPETAETAVAAPQSTSQSAPLSDSQAADAEATEQTPVVE